MAKFDPDAFLASIQPVDAGAHPSGGGFNPDAFLAQLQAPQAPAGPSRGWSWGTTPVAEGAPPDEEPGRLEALGRGVLSGATFGFDDELGGLVTSAFSDKKYTEARDAIRANKAAAQEAHPWAYGLGEVGGGVGVGLATGGAGALVKGAQVGAKGAAAIGAIEGAAQGLGTSEADLTKGDVLGAAKDAAIGGAVGGVTAGVASKLFGKYAGTAEERNINHIAKDLTDGATATEAKRFRKAVAGPVTSAIEEGAETGVPKSEPVNILTDILAKDKGFMQAADQSPKAGAEYAQKKLETLAPKVKGLWKEIDGETGGVPLGAITGHIDTAIEEATLDPNLGHIASALNEVRDDVQGAWLKKYGGDTYKNILAEEMAKAEDAAAAAGVRLSGVDKADIAQKAAARAAFEIQIPSQEVRRWVTGLMKKTYRTLGSINETEHFNIRQESYDVADSFLKGWLKDVETAVPEMKATVDTLRQHNREIRGYASANALMEHVADRARTSKGGLVGALKEAGLPGIGFLAGAADGGNLLKGGAFAAGIRGAQEAGKKLNREATAALAGLMKSARNGNVTAQKVSEALALGVPVASAQAVLTGANNVPEEVRDLLTNVGESALETVNDE